MSEIADLWSTNTHVFRKPLVSTYDYSWWEAFIRLYLLHKQLICGRNTAWF